MTTACGPTRRTKTFEGVVRNLERRLKETESDWAREEISRYVSDAPVQGLLRLPPQARGAVGQGRRHAISARSRRCRSAAPRQWFSDLPENLNAKQNEIAAAHPQGNPRAPALPGRCRPRLPDARRATRARCRAARASASGSPSQIGSGLTGVLYVLDEPSIGLHQRDNDRLLETLKRLRDLGNTVHRGRARRGRDPARPTMSSMSGRAPAFTAAK